MKPKEPSFIEDSQCRNCKSLIVCEDGTYRCEQRGEDVKLNQHCGYFVQTTVPFVPKDKPKKKINQFGLLIDNFVSNVQQFYEQRPFFYDKQNMFWMWNDEEHKYEMVDDTDLMIMLDDMLGFMGQTVNSKLKIQYMEAFKRVGRKHVPKKAPTKWIQFKDRAFSLESGNVYEVQPNYFFTNPIPWELGFSDETPVIDRLITEWVGEDNKQMAYEVIAYCCLSNYPIHMIICLVGCGRNGKSKFLGMISKFLGSDNICSTELDTLLNSRFESFKLYKKLACIMGETNFNVLNKTSLLKKLTGQDLIGFEYKNKKPFDDVNYAKILIGSNSLPVSEDTSEGFYRRWLIINFENIFNEGHDILDDIPITEYNNLAKKVTQILPELIKVGKFSKQGTIEERTERYIMASNPLSNFINKHCVKGYGKYMRYSELYMAYRKFLHDRKKRRVSYKEFNDVLALEGLEVVKTSKKVGEEWINGNFVEGLELKDCASHATYDHNPTLLTNGRQEVETRTQVTQEAQTPIIETEAVTQPEIIHLHCSICDDKQSSFWLPTGKPACLNCYTNYMLQNKKGG